MAAEFGFGIVGWGSIAPFHARAIAELPSARVAAVFTRPEKFAAVRELVGPEVYLASSLEDLLQQKNIAAVNICTPSGLHLEPALAVAAAGKHVVVEKPLEVTLARCDALISACQKAGVVLSTIFPSRFADVNAAVRSAVHGGRFGRITLADMSVKWWRPQSYYDSSEWRGTWKLDGGGALMNQAIHQVDLLQHIMGPIVQVAAFAGLLAHERIEVEDTLAGSVRFASGAVGTLSAATSVFPGLLKTLSIHGDRGSAVVEQDHLCTWRFADETKDDDEIRARFQPPNNQGSVSNTGGAADPKAIAFENHRRQLEDFVAAVTTCSAPAVDGAEGRKAVEIILALYQSQATGQIVELPLERDPSPPVFI